MAKSSRTDDALHENEADAQHHEKPQPNHPDAARQAFLGRTANLKSRALHAARQNDVGGLAQVLHDLLDMIEEQARH